MKILLFGDTDTGKTSLVRQLMHEKFCFTHNSTIHVKEELVLLNGQVRIEATVVDTPGCWAYFDATHQSLLHIDVFVIVFSLTNHKSFENIEYWRNVISKLTAVKPVVWLLGTKSDLADSCVIDDTEIADFVNRCFFRGFFKVSAKSHAEVLRIFSSLMQSVGQVAHALKRSVLFAREIKVCLVGLGSVGCSSLLLRFANDSFSHDYINECQFRHRFLSLSGKKVKVCIHDLSGAPTMSLKSFFHGRSIDVVVLVYDITNLDSLLDLAALNRALNSTCLRVLIGTKCDMSDVKAVTADHVEAFCDREKICCHFEVSAKTGFNVQEAFQAMAQLVIRNSE